MTEQTVLADRGRAVNMPSMGVRSVLSQEIMSVRHALPKTRIAKALLHENVSRDNLLRQQLKSLKTRRQRTKFMLEHSSREFVNLQKRKEKEGKHRDEARLASINLPLLDTSTSVRKRGRLEVLYTSPEYRMQSPPGRASDQYGPLLPEVEIIPPRTEIVTYGREPFVTRLQQQVLRTNTDLDKYDRYCSTELLERENTLTDNRFERLAEVLSDNKQDSEELTTQNDETKSESDIETTIPPPSRKSSSKVIFPRMSPKKRVTISKQGPRSELTSRDSLNARYDIGFESFERTKPDKGTKLNKSSSDRINTQQHSRGSVAFTLTRESRQPPTSSTASKLTPSSLTMDTIRKEHTLPAIHLGKPENTPIELHLQLPQTSIGLHRHKKSPLQARSKVGAQDVLNDFKHKSLTALQRMYGGSRRGRRPPASGRTPVVSARANPIVSIGKRTKSIICVTKAAPRIDVLTLEDHDE